MTTEKKLQIEEAVAGQRLDVWLVQNMSGYSRNQLQQAVKAGHITVNDKVVKPRYELKVNDVVTVTALPDKVVDLSQNVALPTVPIVFENEHVVVIDKPAGLAMHPGIGNTSHTVAAWFLDHYPDSHAVGEDDTRPGIVHRLDKDTTGVVILAKTNDAYTHLKQQFAKRHVKKEYQALVFGVPTGDTGRITQPIARSSKNPQRRTIDPAGKHAVTEWRTEATFHDRFALVRCFPLTGRMHQLRVHLHFLGHPIVGDQLYTFKRKHQPPGVSRHLLHAEKLTLLLPDRSQKTFVAPLPEDFSQVLEQLREEFDFTDRTNQAS